MSVRTSVLACGLALLLVAGPALGAAVTVLKLDAATQRRLGVVTQPLTAQRRGSSVTGFARVLDPVPLATLDSDISQAGAALAASQAEATRTRALNAADQTVSKRVAEAASAQGRADQAKVQLLRRRLGLEWGPAVAGLSDARRGQLIADIAAGRAALVRIDSAAGLAQTSGSAVLELGGGVRAFATLMGPTRTGDPRLQSTGVLGLVRGPASLQLGVGTVTPVSLASAGRAGVVVPRAALLRIAGQTFAYIRRDAGSFERRPLSGATPDPAGLFVAAGFRPGDAVVVSGAAQLFAAETPSHEAE
jgi:hypothetical protein